MPCDALYVLKALGSLQLMESRQSQPASARYVPYEHVSYELARDIAAHVEAVQRLLEGSWSASSSGRRVAQDKALTAGSARVIQSELGEVIN